MVSKLGHTTLPSLSLHLSGQRLMKAVSSFSIQICSSVFKHFSATNVLFTVHASKERMRIRLGKKCTKVYSNVSDPDPFHFGLPDPFHTRYGSGKPKSRKIHTKSTKIAKKTNKKKKKHFCYRTQINSF